MSSQSRPDLTLQKIVESKYFQHFLITLILLNAITLGLETTTIGKTYLHILHSIDNVILIIFSIELVMKLIVYRHKFFSSGWNWFDFIIVAISWVSRAPYSLKSAHQNR